MFDNHEIENVDWSRIDVITPNLVDRFQAYGLNNLNSSRPSTSVSGTDNHDTLLGSDRGDWIVGGKGNDYLNGYAENDYLFGGEGDDILLGSSGDDILVGGTGNDKLYGGSGNDVLLGSNVNNLLDGGTGKDILRSRGGKNIFIDRDGGDRLFGGNGKDTFEIGNGSLGATEIYNFQLGQDRIKLLDANISFDKLQLKDTRDGVAIAYQGKDLGIVKGIKTRDLNVSQFEFGNPQLTQALQSTLDRVVKETGTPGATAVLTLPDGTIWSGASGVSDLSSNIVMTLDDRFNIASITKPMTATVTLQLVQEGKLALTDPIAKWLPDIAKSLPNGAQITIEQLLNHTSGLPDYSNSINDDLQQDPTLAQKPWTVTDILARYIYGKPALSSPGQSYNYSSTNYRLLEAAIEAVTQTNLGQQFQTRIFDPLGMKDSFYANIANIPGGATHGYLDTNGDRKVDLDTSSLNLIGINGGAGGVVASTGDIARFTQSLLNGELLAPATIQTFNPLSSGKIADGIDVIGASGRNLGWSGNTYSLPNQEVTITTQTNSLLPTEPDRTLFYSLLDTVVKNS